jgi:hypothetical protein
VKSQLQIFSLGFLVLELLGAGMIILVRKGVSIPASKSAKYIGKVKFEMESMCPIPQGVRLA